MKRQKKQKNKQNIPPSAFVHLDSVLVQCAEPELLEEIVRHSSLGKCVVKKISPTALLIDPEGAEKAFNELTKKGYMPRQMGMGKE